MKDRRPPRTARDTIAGAMAGQRFSPEELSPEARARWEAMPSEVDRIARAVWLARQIRAGRGPDSIAEDLRIWSGNEAAKADVFRRAEKIVRPRGRPEANTKPEKQIRAELSKVVEAWAKDPRATDKRVAGRLGVSERTARRWRRAAEQKGLMAEKRSAKKIPGI